MLKLNHLHYYILIFILTACQSQKSISSYQSENLRVEKLTANTYRHITYLNTTDYGKVSCNGMIVVSNGEALIVDTPTNDKDSKELIDWVKNTLKCKVIGVVVTHFHNDCLGGLHEFHKQSIPSYASSKTIELAKMNKSEIPQIGFEDYHEIKVGKKMLINEFFGEGHTKDNIISYFAEEQVIFGGCLIKSLNASKGYLGDANTDDWPKTVRAIKSKYKNLKIIIPGHGEHGNMKLLDYTIELFDKN